MAPLAKILKGLEEKAEKHEPYIFFPNLNEIVGGRLRLRYSMVNDTYFRDYEDTLNPKSKNTNLDWQSVLYGYEALQKYRDDVHDELYLDRKGNNKTAFLSWKFDFTASGLEVDSIQMKIEVVKTESGRALVSIFNEEDTTEESSLEEEVNIIRSSEFSGSKTLTVKLSISADKPGRFTKLFLQSTAGKKLDCPLDINIRLQRPAFTLGRSLLLLGLMFTKEKLADYQRKGRQKRTQKENKKCFLYVHVHQAKRLPLRLTGTVPDPQVKCKLLLDSKEVSCKTSRLRKRINPVWDEQFLYEGITEEVLPSIRLQFQVTHDVRAFNRCKKRETLGSIDIQLLSWLESGSEEESSENVNIQNVTKKPQQQTSCDITCGRLSGSERSLQRLTNDDDIIDFMLNGSNPDLASKPFNDEQNENALNRHRSVSLTSLQSAAKGSILDIDISEQKTWWREARRKSIGKILSFGVSKEDKDALHLKRPSIVLSNSQESVVVLESNEPLKDEERTLDDEEEEQNSSTPAYLNDVAFKEGRRTTLTPLIDSTIETFVEPLAQVQEITSLSASHLEQIISHKGRWLYCWHPLSFMETS